MRCNLCLHKVNWLHTRGYRLGGCVSGGGDVMVMWWRGGEVNDGGVCSGKYTYYPCAILLHITQQHHIKAHHNGSVLVLCKSSEKDHTTQKLVSSHYFCSSEAGIMFPSIFWLDLLCYQIFLAWHDLSASSDDLCSFKHGVMWSNKLCFYPEICMYPSFLTSWIELLSLLPLLLLYWLSNQVCPMVIQATEVPNPILCPTCCTCFTPIRVQLSCFYNDNDL